MNGVEYQWIFDKRHMRVRVWAAFTLPNGSLTYTVRRIVAQARATKSSSKRGKWHVYHNGDHIAAEMNKNKAKMLMVAVMELAT